MNTCHRCGSTYPSHALSCPSCQALTHQQELTRLASAAKEHAEAQRATAESETLEKMLLLLPPATAQTARLKQRLSELSGAPAPEHANKSAAKRIRVNRRHLGIAATVGLVLWKFKAIIVFMVTKGKALLLGLTKAKTLFSMIIALGAYWTIWGWQFALGFILSIYVHEMGHVIALRRAGIPASAPMFIPFVGAFVRLHRGPDTEEIDARIGLAGPIYGLGAALFCLLLFYVTDISLFGALAKTGAWINLFNLIPVWQLDGGRGFNAMNQQHRYIASAVVLATWYFTGEGMLILLLLGCAYQLFARKAPETEHREAIVTYCALVAVLGGLAAIELPELHHRAVEGDGAFVASQGAIVGAAG